MHEKFWQFLNNSTFITPIYPPSPEIMQTQLHMHLIQTQPFRISCPLPPDSPNSYIDDTSVNYVDPEYLWCVLIILLDAIKHTYDNKLIILQEYMQTNQKIQIDEIVLREFLTLWFELTTSVLAYKKIGYLKPKKFKEYILN